MKKLILLFLLIPSLLFAQEWQEAKSNPYILGAVTTAGDTYSDILFWWRCESATMGAGDHSHGDTTASANGTIAYNTDAVKMGTNGLDCPTNEDYAYFSVSSSDIFVESAGRLGFWVNFNTVVAATFLLDVTVATGTFRLYMDGTDDLTFRYNDGVGGDRFATTTTAGLTTATWYFIEIAWDVSTELQKIFVGGVEKASNTQAKASTGAASVVKFGVVSNSVSDLYMDNIIISNDPARNLYLLSAIDNFPG